jgi:hypothetical protein
MIVQNLLYLTGINIAIICLGYWFAHKKLISASWFLCLFCGFLIHSVFLSAPATIRMFALITTVFMGMKVITAAVEIRNKPFTLTFPQWLVFCLTWAGMRAEIFKTAGLESLPGAKRMIVHGILQVMAGVSLVVVAHYLASVEMNASLQYLLITSALLIAFSLTLHFGILAISAGVWRYFGVDTYLLFNEPLKSGTLNEFWSRRWNIAFSEMTSIAVFRPLKQKIGAIPALLLAFMFSGVLHEMAISVPVNKGYGLPMAYFVIQGLAVALEKFLITKNIIRAGNTVIDKIWLFSWLVIPLPLLFHKPFITGIIWPLAGLHVP